MKKVRNIEKIYLQRGSYVDEERLISLLVNNNLDLFVNLVLRWIVTVPEERAYKLLLPRSISIDRKLILFECRPSTHANRIRYLLERAEQGYYNIGYIVDVLNVLYLPILYWAGISANSCPADEIKQLQEVLVQILANKVINDYFISRWDSRYYSVAFYEKVAMLLRRIEYKYDIESILERADVPMLAKSGMCNVLLIEEAGRLFDIIIAALDNADGDLQWLFYNLYSMALAINKYGMQSDPLATTIISRLYNLLVRIPEDQINDIYKESYIFFFINSVIKMAANTKRIVEKILRLCNNFECNSEKDQAIAKIFFNVVYRFIVKYNRSFGNIVDEVKLRQYKDDDICGLFI